MKSTDEVTMAVQEMTARAQAVRRFNRFYTRQIGALNDGLLQSPWSLTEVRVLYELAQRATPTAADLADDLGIDAGYLSRILQGFRRRELVRSTPSPSDARRSLLVLTPAGTKAFAELDAQSSKEVGELLRRLTVERQRRLVAAMGEIEQLLAAPPASANGSPEPYALRLHVPGDMGWIVHRHGVLYHQEYGWDERFEGLVAGIVSEFIANLDTRRERCWVAERGDEIVGCVFLVKKTKKVAKLRLLLVEPSARGLGLGRRLVDECVGFARQCGYRKLTLWTQSILHAARHIYEEAGFRLVREEKHRSLGPELVAETWELDIQ